MAKQPARTKKSAVADSMQSARPKLRQRAHEIQAFGQQVKLPIALPDKSTRTMVELLNQLLADTMTLRDMYKKHHWQVAGPTFNQLHLLFDKHYEQQVEMVDAIAERIQLLGGVGVAMGVDAAEMTVIPRPPRGREEAPVQLSRLLEAHEMVILETRSMARKANDLDDFGSNDLLVSGVLRMNELQVWFLSEHLVNTPLTVAA
ncbi:MAG TPA: DNA starvation/stationary phase protection protein [Usitatibacteraceae bacterium]